MITGYFQIKKDSFRLTKIFGATLFYALFCIVFYLILFIIDGCKDSQIEKNIIWLSKALLSPVSGNAWWFVSSYVFLMIFSPLLNKVLIKLNKRGWIVAFLLLYGIWYAYGSIVNTGYYSLMRSVVFYALGGYYRLFNNYDGSAYRNRWKNRFYVLPIILLWVSGSLLNLKLFKMQPDYEISIKMKLIQILLGSVWRVIIVPLCSCFIFSYFVNLNIRHSTLINGIAGTTFGVYLLHESRIGRSFIWDRVVNLDSAIYSPLFPVIAILCIMVIFFVCSFIDCFRIKIFEPVYFRIENKIKSEWSQKILK